MGPYSHMGYKSDSPDRHRPANLIASGRITMQGVPFPVLGIDDQGNTQMMMPGEEYNFPGKQVLEIPVKNNAMYDYNFGGLYQLGHGGMPCLECGGTHHYQDGGEFVPHTMYDQDGNAYWAGTVEDHLAYMNMGYTHEMKKGGNWIQKATKSIEKRGTKGVCTGDKFGSSSCPPGSKRYNLAKTFRKMAAARKKEMGGVSMSLQNVDTNDYVANMKNTMEGYLSNNAMNAMALEEARNMVKGFMMQLGGSFGYDPNQFNQNEYAMMSNNLNDMKRDLGDLFSSTYNTFATANPYYKLQVKQIGGETYTYYPEATPLTDEQKRRFEGSRQDAILLNQLLEGEQPQYFIQPSGSASGFGAGQTNRNMIIPKGYSRVPQQRAFTPQNTGTPATTTAVPAESKQDVAASQPVSTPVSQPVTGNYVAPQQVDQSQQPYYIPGAGQQMMFPQAGFSPFTLFPMNARPGWKMKGRGPMFSGVPNIAYNPNETYLKDFTYKNRLFGPGPRKIKMTFAHGLPTNVAPMDVAPPTSTSQELDAYIEREMDPTLYSKMIHGDASESDIKEFNQRYSQLQKDFYGSRQRQFGEITPETKTPLGAKFQNFLQERRAERMRRKADRQGPEFQTAVHPLLRQFGGEAYDNPDAALDESTLIWKRKMGIDPEAAVNWTLAGMNTLSSVLESRDAAKNAELLKERMAADAVFRPLPFGQMSRGDYETNTGMFRPDEMVPVQFSGRNMGSIGSPYYKQGGEYVLNDAQIQDILKNGGTVEYID